MWWDSPSFFRVTNCGFKPICQIKKGSTLVNSAHFKPEDMFKTITGPTLGPRRVKSADKTNHKSEKICGPASRREATSILCHKKLLAESAIERQSRSLITRASNSSLVTTRFLLTSKFGLSSCLVAAIHFDLNKSFEGKLKKDKVSPLLLRLSSGKTYTLCSSSLDLVRRAI